MGTLINDREKGTREQSNFAFTVIKYIAFVPAVAWLAMISGPWIQARTEHFILSAVAIVAVHLVFRSQHRAIIQEHCNMPRNSGNGEFAVFVVVSRVDPGAIKVNPKDFFGLFSDPSHSRFTIVDKAAELQWQGGPQPPSSGNPNGNAQANVGALAASIAGPPPGGGGPSPGGPGDSGPPGAPQSTSKGGVSGPAPPALYFHSGKVQQGGTIFGWVTFRPAKGAKLEVHATDMLSEINIPVNGVVYRF